MITPCLSHLRCDQLLAGELGAAEALARAHVASCRACAARLADHRRERAAFAIPLPSRARLPRVPVAAVAALAAAAVALAVWATRPRADAPAADAPEADAHVVAARPKGDAFALGLYVRHAGVVRRGGAGERVAPGDAIEFTATAARAGFVAVVSVDATGAATVYYPAGAAAAPLSAGRDQLLPSSVVLDDALGGERLVGLLCDRALDLDAAVAAVGAGAVPPGCATDVLAIEKRRAP